MQSGISFEVWHGENKCLHIIKSSIVYTFRSPTMHDIPSFIARRALMMFSVLFSTCIANPVSPSVFLSTGSDLAGLAPFGITTASKA